MKRRLFFLLTVCVAFFSCEEGPAVKAEGFLFQKWTHAMEEQEDANSNLMIFRLTNSQIFPASRFRDAYEFSLDGSCRYLFLHPADAHHFKQGTFTYDQSDRVLLIYNEVGDLHKTFHVQELTADQLVMEWQP